MPPFDPIERNLEIAGAGKAKAKEERQPIYKMVGDSKIPVSKHLGSLWASRKDQGVTARSNSVAAWDEALRYYDNDQSIHRSGDGGNIAPGNRSGARLTDEWRETENVVFSNCSIMVPMLYAKNPQVTITSENDANEMRCKAAQRLVNSLLAKKEAPGLNFKHKARRSILIALLTNSAFVKIGYTLKQDSSEEAVAELQNLSIKLEGASKKKEIEAI